MRLASVAFVAIAGLSGPAYAQQPAPAELPSVATTQQIVTKRKEGLATEAEASRLRTETRERDWDRKMRASTNSICKGC
jgi:hypothetical protein